MVRFLLLLLGTLTAGGPRRGNAAWYRAGEPDGDREPGPGYPEPAGLPEVPARSRRRSPCRCRRGRRRGADRAGPPERSPGGPRRRRIPLGSSGPLSWLVVGLIFRKAIASVVLMALAAALHLVGINVHLPSVKFALAVADGQRGTTTNTDLGPWVLQKIEGISRPALGQANFNFLFTHKVSKSIGPWPCWYASTFYAVAHASATVDLNPGPAWWAPGDRALPAAGP